MGMTIDEARRHLDTWSTTHGSGITTDEQHEQAKKIAIDTMRKYQMMQADYESRLKADLEAILVELQLKILELKSYESSDGQDLVMLADIGILFQQKIEKLKENKGG